VMLRTTLEDDARAVFPHVVIPGRGRKPASPESQAAARASEAAHSDGMRFRVRAFCAPRNDGAICPSMTIKLGEVS
jgi:hypothetical protein